MNRIFAVIAGLTLGTSSLVFADTFTFNVPANTNLGNTHTFVFDGANIVASGFFQNNIGTNLFAKSGGENGIGLTRDPTGDNEIWYKSESKDFIQLDLTDALNKGLTNLQFEMDSTTDGEQWQVSACTTAGTLCSNGSSLIGSGEGAFIAMPANFGLSHPYLDFISYGCQGGNQNSCGGDNVLLTAISATPGKVPEPDSIVLLSTVVLGLAGFAIRRKRVA
jgi:hypothetical protein